MRFKLDWQCDPYAFHDVRTGSEMVEAADMVEACVLARKEVAERLKVPRNHIHITVGTIYMGAR